MGAPRRVTAAARRLLVGAAAVASSLVNLAITVPAAARPPPPGSAQAEDMAPYADEIRRLLTATGRKCCDESDCRKVRAELRNDGHWWVYVNEQDFPNGQNAWQMVPDWTLIEPKRRPMLPWALACWVWFPNLQLGAFQCFTPPTGM